MVKRGTTGKDAQQCWCKDCETYFNDLSDSIFGQYHFELEDLFYMVKEMRSDPRTQITRNLGRDYEAALDFVHEVQETSVSIGEFDLSEMCEADEVDVITGEKGRVRTRIRVRASADSKKGMRRLRKKPASLTLICQISGQVRFIVCRNLQKTDEELAAYGDDSVILCMDGYSIYEEIEEKKRGGGVDGHLAVTHSDTYVISGAHTNSCENPQSFLRQWLGKFRGISKHHLQKYLNFLARKPNSPEILLYYNALL